jgi:thiamine-phosphate pyrophosphorylase
MQLYLISYDQFFKGEEDLISDLLYKYKFTFHLRKPGATLSDYSAFLLKIPQNLHHKIMLHDAFELIKDFEVKGLHFSSKNKRLKSNYEPYFCSTSSHKIAEIAEHDHLFNYQFLSPVYTSISKPGYTGNLDLIEVKDYLKSQRTSKVIALGGVTENNIELLHQIGFDGVATLGRIWGNSPQTDKKITERFYKIYKCINRVPIV